MYAGAGPGCANTLIGPLTPTRRGFMETMSPTVTTCQADGCGHRSRVRGRCHPHYWQARRNGVIERLPLTSPREYVNSKIRRSGTNSCWEWTGHLNKGGYGTAGHRGRRTAAHRFSYEAFVEHIPEGLHIDHLCRNRSCVNPRHLEPVTLGENSRRGVLYQMLSGPRGCKQHGFEDGRMGTQKDSRYDMTRDRWVCRICQRERSRKSKQKRRQLAA